MKYILVAFMLLTIGACNKNQDLVVPDLDASMTVVKNCTGVYLSYNGKNYLVCNSSLLKNYKEGEKVTAELKIIENCKNPENVTGCAMAFPYELQVQLLALK